MLWSTAWGGAQRLRDTGDGGLQERSHSPGRSGSEACLPEKAAAAPKEPTASRAAAGAPQSPPVLARRRARPSPLLLPPRSLSGAREPHPQPPLASGAASGHCKMPPLVPVPSLRCLCTGHCPRSGVSARMRPLLLSLPAPLCPPAPRPPPPAASCHLGDACLPVPSTAPHARRGAEPSPEAPTSRRPAPTCAPTASSSSAACRGPAATRTPAASPAATLLRAAGPHSQTRAHPHAGRHAMWADAEPWDPGGPLRTHSPAALCKHLRHSPEATHVSATECRGLRQKTARDPQSHRCSRTWLPWSPDLLDLGSQHAPACPRHRGKASRTEVRPRSLGEDTASSNPGTFTRLQATQRVRGGDSIKGIQ